MIRSSILCGLALLLPIDAGLFAQEGPRVVKMTVSPTPKSAAPMSYALIPQLRDMKPANAALFYERSQSQEWWTNFKGKQHEMLYESLERPWNPATDKAEWLPLPLKEIDYAARCEHCDWQLTDRLRTDGFWFLMPDMQTMRTLNVANSFRIRSAIHQGKFDEAAHGLQTSFAMSKHVGEAPMAITYLVGTSLAAMSQRRIEEWIEQPNAPNLYWPLTDLPSPLIDWRRPLEGEAVVLEQVLPEIQHALHEPKPSPISPDAIRNRLKSFAELGVVRYQLLEWSLLFVQEAGPARERLAAKGLTAEELDRLPVIQVVLMDLMRRNDEHLQGYLRLRNLPYWQARPFLNKMNAEYVERRNRADTYRIIDMWSPALDNLFSSRARTERQFGLLRTIEALRLYAAEHDGQWPDTLDDLRPLPVPPDPFTGKAFAYRREGGKAILEAGAPPGQTAYEHNSVRYELTLRGKAPN